MANGSLRTGSGCRYDLFVGFAAISALKFIANNARGLFDRHSCQNRSDNLAAYFSVLQNGKTACFIKLLCFQMSSSIGRLRIFA